MIKSFELPREKIIKKGIEYLSDLELIAVIIRTGSKDKNVVELSGEILKKCNGLSGLANSRIGELLKINGLKNAKACSIIAAIEISRRILSRIKENEIVKITSSKDVFNFIKDQIQNLLQEQFFAIYLNAKNIIIACNKLFIGSLDLHIVHPRDIFREAVKNNAKSLIIIHNHPSGDVFPSNSDLNTTKELIKASEIMGIKLIDHIIVSEEKYFSLKDNGLL
ncbi:MAG: DNA repair protein RadC [Bacilli bacterium]|nr:DNA repair protein RadC [Bacilli bacterium]